MCGVWGLGFRGLGFRGLGFSPFDFELLTLGYWKTQTQVACCCFRNATQILQLSFPVSQSGSKCPINEGMTVPFLAPVSVL